MRAEGRAGVHDSSRRAGSRYAFRRRTRFLSDRTTRRTSRGRRARRRGHDEDSHSRRPGHGPAVSFGEHDAPEEPERTVARARRAAGHRKRRRRRERRATTAGGLVVGGAHAEVSKVMQITRKRTGDFVDIELVGRLDGYWCDHLTATLSDVIREGNYRIR